VAIRKVPEDAFVVGQTFLSAEKNNLLADRMSAPRPFSVQFLIVPVVGTTTNSACAINPTTTALHLLSFTAVLGDSVSLYLVSVRLFGEGSGFMSRSLGMRFAVAATVCTCLVAGYALAQQQGNPGEIKPSQFKKDATDRSATSQNDRSATQQGERSATQRTTGFRGTPATAGSSQHVEQYLAKCLLAKNQGEVELAELAQQQSENPEVKQFAEMLVKDHSAMVQKLQPLAGGQSARGAGQDETYRRENAADAPRLPGSPAANPTRTPDDNSSLTVTEPSGAGAGALMQLAAIEKKIQDQCLQAMREELQQKKGAEFDECFVGSQVGGHMQMVAALEVIGQETQGQLQQIAKQAQPKTQQHLEHAKQLAKQLKSSSTSQGGQAGRQPERTQR